MTAAASRSEPRAQPLPEPRGRRALVGVRQLPRREVEQRHDDRHAATRSAARRRPRGRPRPARPARSARQAGPERRRRGAGTDRPSARRCGGGGSAAAGGGRRRRGRSKRVGRVGEVRLRGGTANDSPASGVGVEGAQQPLEVGGRRGRPVRILDRAQRRGRRARPADGPSRRRSAAGAEPGRGRSPGSGLDAAGAAGRASSSQRSRTTTTSASTMIRRDILDWPTRRSRNVIGTSATRAPRAARPVGHLDLEHVAAGVDAVERDRREGRGAPRLEAAGEVVRLEAEDDPREQAAAARDDPPADAPVHARRRPSV